MIGLVAPLVGAAALASQLTMAAPLPSAPEYAPVPAPAPVHEKPVESWQQPPAEWQPPAGEWKPPARDWQAPPAEEWKAPVEPPQPVEEPWKAPEEPWKAPPAEEWKEPEWKPEPPKEHVPPPPAPHGTYVPPAHTTTATYAHETYTTEEWKQPPAEYAPSPVHEQPWVAPTSYPPPTGWYEGAPVPDGWYTSESAWYKYEDLPYKPSTVWEVPAHPTPYPEPPKEWKEGSPPPEGWYTSEAKWYKYEPKVEWPQEQPKHEVPPSGATHTVYVAPEGYKGYVPFSVDANVGDVVEFVWKKGPHTASKSSLNNICSRIEDGSFFTSGRLEAGATFQRVVNDTNPTWLYDNVDNNCENGFWGVINAPKNVANATVGEALQRWTEQFPDLKKQWEYIKEKGSDPKYETALKWGDSIDVGKIEEKYHYQVAEKVMETRYWMVVNDGVVDGGKRKDGQEIVWPDLKAEIASANVGTTPEEEAALADSTTPANTSAGFAVRPAHALAGLVVFLSAFML